MAKSTNLEEMVHEALDNAVANDYDIVNWDDEQVTRDLAEYDADLEVFTHEELLPHVTSWRAKRGVPTCGRVGKEV